MLLLLLQWGTQVRQITSDQQEVNNEMSAATSSHLQPPNTSNFLRLKYSLTYPTITRIRRWFVQPGNAPDIRKFTKSVYVCVCVCLNAWQNGSPRWWKNAASVLNTDLKQSLFWVLTVNRKWCLNYAVNLPFLNYFKYAAQLTLAGVLTPQWNKRCNGEWERQRADDIMSILKSNQGLCHDWPCTISVVLKNPTTHS